MIYDIKHRTTFDYENTVSLSQHVFHLAARAHPLQRRITVSTTCDPAPAAFSEIEDYFLNPVQFATIQEPHRRLVVDATSRIEVFDHRPAVDIGGSKAWEEVVRELSAAWGDTLDAYQFIFDSPMVRCDVQTREYAMASFRPGRPVLEAVLDLTQRIHADFEYKGGVSDVATPVAEVLRMRQGVCQDFAHLELACLRSLGLAARYVSGYLLTWPPEGQEKLQGADASHAWVSVWSPEAGWIDFDPTNNMIPAHEHVTIAWGRDYGDVSPIYGFIVGGGEHEIAVAVDVAPLA
jgi:transglutaminase-like putative cysteine protease